MNSHDARQPWASVGRAGRAASEQLRSLVRPLSRRDFMWLWLAQVTSELGDWATRLAMTLVVYDRTHSAALSAAVVTVSLIPWAGLGQVVTAAVDHRPRKVVMIAADLVRAAVFGLLVLPVPVPAVFAGAFLGGLATAPFEGARYSIRVEVTDDDELYSGAITLFGITSQVTTILGFAIGGVLVALVGARVAFAVNALSFLASAGFVSRVRTRTSGRAGDASGRRHLADAVRVLLGDPVLRWCTTLALSSAFAGMAIEAIAAPYGRGHPARVAALAIAVPVGLIVAGIVSPHHGEPRRLLRVAGLIPMIGGGLGLVLFASGRSLVLGILGFAASGLAVSVYIPAGPVVGRRVDPEHRAPVFSILQGAALGGQAAGAAAGGLIAGIFGPRPTCIAACAALCLLGAAASARVPEEDVLQGAPAPPG
ncbi:MAG: MFS transporter [Acidimicrobiales bacterium]